MVMFEIKLIEVEPCKSYTDLGALRIHVKWTCREKDLTYFGELNKYTRAVEVPDVEAYENHYEEAFQDDNFVPVEGKPGLVEWKPKHPTVFDLGLLKFILIQGCDHIYPVEGEENTYSYKEYVADCYITRACILQLAEMKQQMEEGVCIYGDFPDQVGCFSSGDVLSDFAAVLQSLDKFWD